MDAALGKQNDLTAAFWFCFPRATNTNCWKKQNKTNITALKKKKKNRTLFFFFLFRKHSTSSWSFVDWLAQWGAEREAWLTADTGGDEPPQRNQWQKTWRSQLWGAAERQAPIKDSDRAPWLTLLLFDTLTWKWSPSSLAFVLDLFD